MIRPDLIKVEVHATHLLEGIVRKQIIASHQLHEVVFVDPFHAPRAAELAHMEDHLRRTIWHRIYGDLQKPLRELLDLFHRTYHPLHPEYDYLQEKIVHILSLISYQENMRRSAILREQENNPCHPKNPQHAIPAIFSTPPTVPEKEANPGQSTQISSGPTMTPSTGDAKQASSGSLDSTRQNPEQKSEEKQSSHGPAASASVPPGPISDEEKEILRD